MLSREDGSKKSKKKKIATKKDFSSITNAYKFFKEHSTEYEANRHEIILKLEQSKLLERGISILDFGGGDGELLSDLYSKTDINKFDPKLYIFEPVENYQESAKSKLALVGYNNLVVLEKIDELPDATLDLILVNHVLYYVENLDQTISKLRSKLNENGQLWILMADENNSADQLWEVFFEKLGMKVPYFLTNDLRFILDDQSVQYLETREIKSTFFFKNSNENRSSLVRFLLGNYSERFNDETIKEAVSCYEEGSDIRLPLSDSLFAIRK